MRAYLAYLDGITRFIDSEFVYCLAKSSAITTGHLAITDRPRPAAGLSAVAALSAEARSRAFCCARRQRCSDYFAWAQKTFWVCGVRCGVRVIGCAAVEEGSSSFLGFHLMAGFFSWVSF